MPKNRPAEKIPPEIHLDAPSRTLWVSHPLWKAKFTIGNQEDLQQLMEPSGSEIKGTDTALDVVAEAAIPTAEAQKATGVEALEQIPHANAIGHTLMQRQQPSIEQEVACVGLINEWAERDIDALYDSARLGNVIITRHLEPLVDEIVASIVRNPGVFVSLLRPGIKDDETHLHAVAVCVLMISLGRQLNFESQELRYAGMAGLLHDIGKAKAPQDILNKPGRLTEEEFAVIRRHTLDGYNLLPSDDAPGALAARDVALHHHERFDGSGYPEGLSGNNISVLARMSAVCDVYDAITSNRPYKTAWNSVESICRMSVWAKEGHFDIRIFQAFVKSIGIYPTGSLVRLQSKHLAVVLDQCKTSALKPRIKAFFSITSNLKILPVVIDLADPAVTEKIVCRESPEDWKITHLDEIWTGVVAHNA